MKKIFRLTLMILVLAAVAVTAAACSSVDSISIEEADMPCVRYVQGQDLDLSGGSLTVTSGSDTEKIGLTAEGVSVSGYDKNKVGEQTVTVTYKRKTTSFNVTVIAQLSAENYQTDYFVGEDFNASRGRLTVAREDCTLYAVSMSDAVVTGFDSSSAGTVTVTAEYQGSVGTFDVKIHDIGSVELTAPTKKAYYSHEIGGLSLSGGSITVKSTDGTYSTNVALSALPAESINGFNLSAATEDNMNKPLGQTVTVSYCGKELEFTVNITYSSISYVKEKASQFIGTDWTNPPEIGVGQGTELLNALEKYSTFTANEKVFVTLNEVFALVQASAYYGLQAWKNAVADYSDVFTFTDNGSINLVAETPAVTKAAYDKLKNANEPIVYLSKMLSYISENYSAVVLGRTTLEKYLAEVYTGGFDSVTSTLDYMLKLNDKFADVNGWTDDDIKNIIGYMKTYNRFASSDAVAYKIVAEKWNEVEDFFGKLFDYCYRTDDADTLNRIKEVQHPEGMVGELYNAMINISVESMLMSYGYEADATWFLVYYNRAYNLVNELSSASEGIQKWMFNNLSYNGSSLSALLSGYTTSTYGYLKICGNALFSENAYNFLTEYLALMEDYTVFTENNSANYWSNTTNADKIIALWNSFAELTPMEQMEFLGVINTYYADKGIPAYAFDISSGAYTQFVYLVVNCYASKLDDDEFDVFTDVMLATEKLSRKYLDTDGSEVLSAAMSALESKINALTGKGLDNYNTYVKSAYELLKTRYDLGESETPTDLGEWQETFDALADALARVQFAYAIINRAAPNNYNLYSALFSAYETAAYLSNLILKSGVEAVINAYYYKAYTITLLGYANAFTIDWTLDYGMWVMRTVYASYQRNLSIAGFRLLYLYGDGMCEIMRAADPVIWWGVYGSFTNMPEVIVDEEVLIDAMTAYRNLDSVHKTLFSALDADYNLYYRGIRAAAIKEELSASARAVVEKLVSAEEAYTAYGRNDTYLAEFIGAAQELQEAYNALEDDDKAQFNALFKSAYDFYIDAYGKLSE